MTILRGKTIALGVTGSIAAFKAADLASKLTQEGAHVDVALTGSAQKFVAPLTFRSLTGRQVYTGMFNHSSPLGEQHVALARAADAVVVAPATATVIGRIAHGLADDLVSLTVLATRAPVLLCPAMDAQMYENAATQANLAVLVSRGVKIVGPAAGRLASGYSGPGRLVEVGEIIGALRYALGRTGDLAGRRIVVTAGGTQEPIDPVRYISNYSSGKMGYALAEASRDRGAEVTLVATPTALEAPYGVRVVPVKRAEEMKEAVMAECQNADVLIMAAAVADYQPAEIAGQKIKRAKDAIVLNLTPTSDILAQIPDGRLIKVGFAAESQNLLANAEAKLKAKGLHLIVANDITAADAGFGADTNRVVILHQDSAPEQLPLMLKYDVASHILDRVVALLPS